MRRTAALAGFLLTASIGLHAQAAPAIDSDRDGLSDSLEAALLQRFAPTLMVSRNDCSVRPARFQPGTATPTVAADDGTLYGQAFRRSVDKPEIELHYYHLWRNDCGRMGHALDTEHVAVMLEPGGDASDPAQWRATYWYAAAHEDTVCDASQITRASTLNAETHGATMWISSGKHASFLNEQLCHHGCGGDRCADSVAQPVGEVVNLGELHAPMSGAVWMHSTRWPLADKLGRTDFPADRVARLQRLPLTDIAWANPAKRPAQAAILGGNSAVDGAVIGGTSASGAVATGARSTDTAISIAGDRTGGALRTATRNTGYALGTAWRHVRGAVRGGTKDQRATPNTPR